MPTRAETFAESFGTMAQQLQSNMARQCKECKVLHLATTNAWRPQFGFREASSELRDSSALTLCASAYISPYSCSQNIALALSSIVIRMFEYGSLMK
jgi:hypothetical protein